MPPNNKTKEVSNKSEKCLIHCIGISQHTCEYKGKKCCKCGENLVYSPSQQKWEELFDEKYLGTYGIGTWTTKWADDIKDFIKTTVISEVRREEREKYIKLLSDMKPILWNDNKDRYLENVAVFNFIEKAIKLLQDNSTLEK